MTKIYTLICTFFLVTSAYAQFPGIPDLSGLGVPLDSTQILDGVLTQDPNGTRYKDPVFRNVLLTSGIPFGSAEVVFGEQSSEVKAFPLFMDVYQPAGDLLSEERPVIILAFGGAFVYGARVSPDIVQLAMRYAQLGYVVASIDYRLSDELLVDPKPENAVRAVGKAMHDMRSSVRFMRRQNETLGNLLNINTNQIYVGGVSAGAFAALHTAYLDRLEELPANFQPIIEDLGGIEGESGNPGFSSAVAGVINLCGALGEADWLEVGDVPLVSMHGDQDGTVPYDRDTVRVLGINYPVSGSADIKRHADTIGVENDFYTWIGADHVPFILPNPAGQTEAAYLDTAFWFTRDFMFRQVSRQSVGVNEKVDTDVLSIYPNPAKNQIQFTLENNDFIDVEILSITGAVISKQRVYNNTTIDISTYNRGIYLLKYQSGNAVMAKKIILE